jgi:dienelactone hydrolase
MHNQIIKLFMSVALFLGSANAVALEYEVKPVAYKNLVANLYLPKVTGKVPVVIAFGGSDGGLHGGNANGELLAPHGMAVLALAYFKADGLSPTLDQIPLEYFVNAIDFLETVPAVDSAKIGLVSGSRGSEAALLLASIDPRIKSLAVTTPSKVAWLGMTKPRSAWTFKGKDIPALRMGLDSTAPNLSRFDEALKSEESVAKALFAFEKINGAILLVSAEHDQIWPSTRMARDIEAYLRQHSFKHSVKHDAYPTGHGFSKQTAPTIKQSIIDHFLRTL